jgi:hypothetical protein
MIKIDTHRDCCFIDDESICIHPIMYPNQKCKRRCKEFISRNLNTAEKKYWGIK